MIDKIINLLIVLGIAFLTGYGMWEISNLHGFAALMSSALSFTLIMGIVWKYKSNNLNFSQFLGIVGAHFGGMFIFKGLDLIPDSSGFIIDLKVLISAGLSFAYFYTFHKKVAPTMIYFVLRTIAGILFIGTILNMARVYINSDLVINLASAFVLWEAHKVQIKDKKSMLSFLLSDTFESVNSKKEKVILHYNPGLLDLFTAIPVALMMWYSISFGSLQNIPFYTLTSLYFGLLTALNSKSKPVVFGFWASLVMIFVSLCNVLNLSTSASILIAGLGCLGIALMLKKLKDKPELFKGVKSKIASYVSDYEVKDLSPQIETPIQEA